MHNITYSPSPEPGLRSSAGELRISRRIDRKMIQQINEEINKKSNAPLYPNLTTRDRKRRDTIF